MNLNKTELAKKIAKALRHDPDKLDLRLDDEGWVFISDLRLGFESLTPYAVSRENIVTAVTDANRGRFEYDEAEGRVRALKGHTTSQVDYKAAEPPDNGMYCAISSRHAVAVEEYGLRKVRKRYTEVFPSYLDAVEDGKSRRIRNMSLVFIKSHAAYHDGTVFYEHEDQWYIEEVDPVHLEILEYDESE